MVRRTGPGPWKLNAASPRIDGRRRAAKANICEHATPRAQWLTRVVVDAIHEDQSQEHGGLCGVQRPIAAPSASRAPRRMFASA
jgi:hypothetical protein